MATNGRKRPAHPITFITGGNEMSDKGRWFSNTKANWILIASLIIVVLASCSSIWFIPIPPPHIETDKPIYMLTFATMLAATATLWVSWLIKEEAKEISENVVQANNYIVGVESIKGDFSLFLDVAAVRLEQISKLPAMLNRVVPIEKWNDLPIMEGIGTAPGRGMPKDSEEYKALFHQIQMSMFFFSD